MACGRSRGSATEAATAETKAACGRPRAGRREFHRWFFRPRGWPFSQAARQDLQEADDLVEPLAGATAQRSLCGPGQARGLALARRVQAPGDGRQVQAAEARPEGRGSG